MAAGIQNNNRSRIRNHFKHMREAMDSLSAEQLSRQISDRILDWEIYRSAEKIYFYYPLGNEVSLLPVILHALSDKKRTAFPKVQGSQMSFYEVGGLDELAEGCFHVMEPVSAGRAPADWPQALCFVPGTVFDRMGGRFGYGRGYYDRYFAERTGCRLAGCAYAFQITDPLPLGQWDRGMDYLICENGIVDFSQRIV